MHTIPILTGSKRGNMVGT